MPKHVALEEKVVRCLTLLFAMARARRGVHLVQLYTRRGCAWRTGYRDLETLAAAGVPIRAVERGWHAVDPSWLPPVAVDLRDDERSAIQAACQLAPALRDTSLGNALESLLAKLHISPRQGELPFGEGWLHARVRPAVVVGPGRIAFDLLRDAITTRRPAAILYRRPDGDEHEREVEPLLFHWDTATETFYLVAWCRERDALRTFALQRIQHARLLDGTTLRRTERREALRQAETAYRGWLRPVTERVVLRFAAEVAAEVRERVWHPSQHFVDQPDGGVVLELDLGAPEAIERDVLGFGPDAVVLAPAALADRIRARHIAAGRGEPAGLLHVPITTRCSGSATG